MSHGLFGHAAPGVGDRQHDVAPGLDPGVAERVGAIQLHVGGLEGQAAAPGHGVPGVDRQVHDRLFQLVTVGFRPAQVGGEGEVQLDVFPQGAAEQGLHAHEDLVQAEAFGLKHLASGEGEYLAGEPGRPLPHLFDVDHQFPIPIFGGQGVQEQGAVADDGRQHVVEVVGYAARQPADGLHLLRLPELLLPLFESLLGNFAFGDVSTVDYEEQLTIRLPAVPYRRTPWSGRSRPYDGLAPRPAGRGYLPPLPTRRQPP